MTESEIVGFYRGTGTDHSGRRLDEILQWDDGALERVHDYIQWLFPLDEPSGANWRAPLLNGDDVAEFAADASLRESLHCAFLRMLKFYGFEGRVRPEEQAGRPEPERQEPALVERAANWGARS